MEDTSACLNCGNDAATIHGYCEKCNAAFEFRLEELSCYLAKTQAKKKRAQEMKRCLKHRKIEWIVVAILSSLAGIFLVTVVFLKELPMFSIVVVIVFILVLLVILKTTRYSSFDLNLRTTPEMVCKVDFYDVPDVYLNQLIKEINEIKAKLS